MFEKVTFVKYDWPVQILRLNTGKKPCRPSPPANGTNPPLRVTHEECDFRCTDAFKVAPFAYQ